MVEAIISSNLMQEETRTKDCRIYRMKDNSGSGKATVYTVFPGVFVSLNEFNMSECASSLRYAAQMLGIEYCMEGRVEWEHDDGSFCYLAEGDIQISAQTDHFNRLGFPTKHYRGATLSFIIEQAEHGLREFFPRMRTALPELWYQYSSKKDFFVLREETAIRNIFSELCQNADSLPADYLRVKVMELLLVLRRMKPSLAAEEKPYFKRSQVELVRKIKAFLCEHTDRTPTLQELSGSFGIPLSVLKSCFKSMYGQSVYAFAKEYRLQKAAELLLTTERSVFDIAMDSGYATPSKFTAAFKKRFAASPLKYRKDYPKKDFN